MNELPKSRIIEKLKAIPSERLAEVERYLDRLLASADDRRATAAFLAAAEEPLARVWDNEDDAIYDRL
jgi:hypothetical protein